MRHVSNVIQLAGLGAIVGGVYLLSVEAAVIIGGLALLAVSLGVRRS